MSCKGYPAKRLYTGDVDGNEIVDIVDALLIAQKFVGLNPANFDERTSDTNNDGVSDIIDAFLAAQYYVGLNPASWQD